MKKIFVMSIILFFAICLETCVNAKSTCIMDINLPKNIMSKNEEFTAEIVMSNIQSENGIIAIGAVLEYDKNSMELVKMEGENGWASPSYNEKNGKLVTDKNALAKEDEAIFKVVFRIKEKSKKNISISLKDITIADGKEETKIENVTKTITVKDGNTDNLGTTISAGVLPKTGINDVIIIVISIIAIVYAFFFYIKLKMINHKI